MLKIYFCGSIRGGRELADRYAEFIAFLQEHGEVLTEHIADPDIIEKEEATQSDEDIYIQDINWLLSADIIVAEVTTTSMGVGYEIGYAHRMGKPVLCLFDQNAEHKLSAMISGCEDLQLVYYKDMIAAKEAISDFIAKHKK